MSMRKLINLVESMQSQEHVDINSVVKDLTFVPTTKKPTPYKYVEVDSLDQMPPMSYTKVLSQQHGSKPPTQHNQAML